MSTLEVSNLNDGTTTLATTFITSGSAKVWCRWDFSETNVIKDSLNVSSLSDDSTGTNTINYSSSMSNANYSAVTGTVRNTRVSGPTQNSDVTTSTIKILSYSSSGSLFDSVFASAKVHGDLA
jgi:hypothetical protein